MERVCIRPALILESSPDQLRPGLLSLMRDCGRMDEADVYIALHILLEQLECRISQKLLFVLEICSSSWVAFSGISGRGCA